MRSPGRPQLFCTSGGRRPRERAGAGARALPDYHHRLSPLELQFLRSLESRLSSPLGAGVTPKQRESFDRIVRTYLGDRLLGPPLFRLVQILLLFGVAAEQRLL